MTYSAIIVLGNFMDKKGVLNGESASRMNIAIDAFRKEFEPDFVTCGWAYRDDSSITIADAMKSYAIEIGKIPSELIIAEKNSRDTVGDAVFTKKNIASIRKWKRILVATSDYHVPRAREIFNFVYGEGYSIKIIGAVSAKSKEQTENEKISLRAFYRTFAGIDAGNDELIYGRLREKHPYYNGMVHPKIFID
jgi:uncharacterized SAM-binding protein YcdF (DUF218 family)